MICFGVNRGFRSVGSISLSDSNFLTKPKSIEVRTGSVATDNCFAIASKGATVTGKYRVQFSFKKGDSNAFGDTYTKMPFVNLEVTADKFTLNIPASSACPAGNSGVPIFISLVDINGFNGIPVSDITIAVAVKEDEIHGDKAIVDKDSVTVTFKESSPIHFFSYTCVTGIVDEQTKLTFTLSGTDASYYQLSRTEVKISPITELPAVGDSVATIDLVTNLDS